VPPDDNAAERSLHHPVTSREISSATRSEQGTDTKMVFSARFGTWRARGRSLLRACQPLGASPRV